MKTLTFAETKFVSGTFVRGGQQMPQQHRQFMAMETTSIDSDTDTEIARRMKPACVTVALAPSLGFDAARMAPKGIDEGTYNGFNDQSSSV